MGNFNYLAVDGQNKQVKGTLEAKDILEAKVKLRQSGLYITSIHKERGEFAGKLELGKVSVMDLAVFSHQFSVMIGSGIPLIRTLQALAEETSNIQFRKIINKVRSDVEGGSSLSAAFSKHPKVFSNFFINLIKSGEVSGTLPAILKRLASYLEKEEDIRRKVASAFAYPAIVSIVAVGVVGFLLIFIVPVFQNAYKAMSVELPVPTLVLIWASKIFTQFWWVVLILAILVCVSSVILRKKERWGLILDRFKLRFPLFGPLNCKVAISRFVRTLATMIGSGLTLGSSLNTAKDVVGNKVVIHTIESLQKEISQGRQISDSLKEQDFFPPIVVQMVSVGEESGKLNEMLDKCADFLDEETDLVIKRLMVKLEPILTFGLAVLIGFIALAIYLPMFDLIYRISH